MTNLNQEQKKVLLKIARESIEDFVRKNEKKELQVEDPVLCGGEGSFVTIHKHGELRGCIGQILPGDTKLCWLVQDMAIEAASQDPRFSPVSSDELDEIDIEISVLSEPEEIDDWQIIELGKHGVIVSKFGQGGVFLPQVATETGWSKEEFLGHLCSQKAGFESEAYKNDSDLKIEVFTAQVFGEK